MAMGQNPNRSPSEHPNPTTKISSKMAGAPPKWYPIGFDPQPCFRSREPTAWSLGGALPAVGAWAAQAKTRSA